MEFTIMQVGSKRRRSLGARTATCITCLISTCRMFRSTRRWGRTYRVSTGTWVLPKPRCDAEKHDFETHRYRL